MNNINATHTGLMYGFIPVFLNMDDPSTPSIEARNWLCDVALDIVEPVYGFMLRVMMSIDNSFEPSYAIKVTGEIL